MQTLTPTKARANLTRYLKRALKGDDIGIICDGKVISLRPVEVYAEDYALVEYGLTDAELDRAVEKLNRQVRKGKAKVWNGTAKGLRG